MKRLCTIFLLLAVMLGVAVPAWAANSAQRIDAAVTVHTDRSCTVRLQLRISLDSAQQLTIPLPGTAHTVLLDNQPAQTRQSGDRVLVDLPEMAPGEYILSVQYSLSQAVDPDTGLLTLPLLSGMQLDIQAMEFTVTLPGEPTSTPQFTSGYYQQGIRDRLTVTVSENNIYGYLTAPLKDHETLLLEVSLDPALFYTPKTPVSLPDVWDLAILGCVCLALIYFLVTLLPRAPRITRCWSPPEGISAGEVGTCLTGCGTDLSLLVITWAQLGYLSISSDARGRVLLHKRMQMGNERSSMENRWFQQLFGSKTTVDGTGNHFALLSRKVAAKAPILRQLYAPRSCSRGLFRGLCCMAGMLSGIRLGLLLDMGVGAKTLVVLLLAGGTAVMSFLIQSGGKCLPLRDKMPLWIALICGGGWILLGWLTGHTAITAVMVVLQFVAGLCAAYGGKRSELGKRSMSQLLGLRSHMVNTKTFDLQQLLQKNPNYYYELAPYALAMGVDRKFARHFGKEPLPEGSFLELGRSRALNAAQWAAQLRRTVELLNKRQRRLPLDRLFGK